MEEWHTAWCCKIDQWRKKTILQRQQWEFGMFLAGQLLRIDLSGRNFLQTLPFVFTKPMCNSRAKFHRKTDFDDVRKYHKIIRALQSEVRLWQQQSDSDSNFLWKHDVLLSSLPSAVEDNSVKPTLTVEVSGLMRDIVFEEIVNDHYLEYTVKLARAKLPANAGNFTCSSQVKRSHAQFTCITCSFPVKTGKFTCVEAASTSRRIHANCLQAHVNLPEYHRHFTSSFTCGTHANFPATSMHKCLLLQAKIHATCRPKH